MPDLDYRFDKYAEKYDSEHLERIRAYARESALPERVTVEIGSNRGRFLAAMARRHPERYFLGIELRQKYAAVGQERLEDEGLDNARLLYADANYVLPVVIDDGQIEDIFILFPDPWWKKKHRKRRIIQPEFLDTLAPKMADGGRLWIRTDVGPLADDMDDILRAHPSFESMPIDEIPVEAFPRTTRERSIIEKGLPVHVLYYVKA